MRNPARVALFAAGAIGCAVLAVPAFAALPAFGAIDGLLGDALVDLAIYERHTANTVTAILFDLRSIDTIGEEAILFAAVAGTSLLLRRLRDEGEEPPEREPRAVELARRSPALGRTGVLLVAFTALLGWSMLAHGHLTPGGGFQGGVTLASAVLLVYLLHHYDGFDALSTPARTEPTEGVAIGGLVAVGAVGLGLGLPYLTNVLPLGRLGALPSGGTIPVLNAISGVAVAAGISLILAEFAEQTLRVGGGDD